MIRWIRWMNLPRAPFHRRWKLKSLTIGEKYKILQIKKIATRFGPRVVCTLEGKGDLFLPKRLEKDFDEDIICYLLDGKGSFVISMYFNNTSILWIIWTSNSIRRIRRRTACTFPKLRYFRNSRNTKGTTAHQATLKSPEKHFAWTIPLYVLVCAILVLFLCQRYGHLLKTRLSGPTPSSQQSDTPGPFYRWR